MVEKMHAKTLKVGLVGFGSSVRTFHAPLLAANPHYELLGFLERSKNESSSLWPGKKLWRTLEELLSQDDLDLVIICSPNSSHYSYAKQCLEAGKHVLVEKPFTIHAAEGEELIALAEEKHLVLSVFHNRRYDGDFISLKKIIQEGQLGRIVEFHSQYLRWAPEIRAKPWKEQPEIGNLLLDDLGSHLLDQALILFGEPQDLFCWMDKQRDDTRVEDSFGIIMRCGEVRVLLSAGMLVREAGPRFSVYGNRGNLLKFGLDPQEAQLKAGMSPQDPGFGMDQPEGYPLLNVVDEEQRTFRFIIPTEQGQYTQFYEDLYQAIVRGEKNPVPASEALRVMKLLEAARRSAQEGITVYLGNAQKE